MTTPEPNRKRFSVALLAHSDSPMSAGYSVENNIYWAINQHEAVGMAVLEARKKCLSIHQVACVEVVEIGEPQNSMERIQMERQTEDMIRAMQP